MILEEPEEDEAARVYLQISQARERLAAENARRNIVRARLDPLPRTRILCFVCVTKTKNMCRLKHVEATARSITDSDLQSDL